MSNAKHTPVAKWKMKLTAKLRKHIAETTQRETLAEVKANIEAQRQRGDFCHDCNEIARRLGIIHA